MRYKKQILVFGLLIVTVIVYFYRYFLFQEYSFLSGDPWNSLIPLRFGFIQYLKEGILPLWNPLIVGGTSYLVSGTIASLDPLNLLLLFFPFADAYMMITVIQLLITGIGMYLLLRACKICLLGSIIGALSYMLCDYTHVFNKFHTFFGVTMLLPFVILFLKRSLETGKYQYCFVTALFVALSLFSGNIQLILFLTFTAGFIYCITSYIKFHENALSRRRFFIVIFTILFCSAGLMAIQLLPTIETVLESARRIKIVEPSELRSLSSLISIYLFYYTKPYVEIAFGVGIIPLLFSLSAICLCKKNKEVTFGITLVLVSLIIFMVGDTTPFNFLKNILGIGGTSLLRVHLLFPFAVSFLAGYGVDNFFSRYGKREKRQRDIRLRVLIITGGIYIITVVLLSGRVSSLLGLNIHLGATPTTFVLVRIGILIDILCFIIFALCISKKWRLLSGFILIIGILLSGTYKGYLHQYWEYSKRIPTPIYGIEDVVDETQLFRITSLYPADKLVGGRFAYNTFINLPMAPNQAILQGWSDPGGYVTFIPARWSEFIDLINHNKITGHVQTSFSAITNPFSALVNLINLRYLISTARLESNEQWVLLHKSANARKYSLGTLKHFNIECADSIFLYENLNVLPRAFLVDKYKVIKEEDALVKELTKSDFAPLQYVLLEEKPLSLYEKESQENVLPDIGPGVQIIKYTPNQIKMRTTSTYHSFLVLSDNYYPGWKAFINDKETKIYRAYYTFRAIQVSPGEHKIEFIYDPLSFKVGKVISLSTLIFLSLFCCIKFYPRLCINHRFTLLNRVAL